MLPEAFSLLPCFCLPLPPTGLFRVSPPDPFAVMAHRAPGDQMGSAVIGDFYDSFFFSSPIHLSGEEPFFPLRNFFTGAPQA